MIISRVNFEFEFVDPCLCNAWVAVAIGGSALIGGAASIYGADKAASAQESAATTAANAATAQYQQTRSDLSPYRDIGSNASTQLTSRLSDLTAPIVMDESTLQNTPGYQFNLTQGLKAAQNSAAARGLGTSGAALKGASTFATGLADNTYQNQFNNANINQTNAFNRLSSLVNTGENASAQTGASGTAAASQVGAAATNSGNAAAAAYNAIGTGVGNATNGISTAALYKGIYGNNPSSSGPSAGPITYGGPNGPVPFS